MITAMYNKRSNTSMYKLTGQLTNSWYCYDQEYYGLTCNGDQIILASFSYFLFLH